jgi:predicted Zn-dependent protease
VGTRLQGLLAWLHRPWLRVAILVLAALGLAGYPTGRYWYAEVHLRAAEQAAARYDWDEAREELATCLRVRPRSAALHFRLAQVARRTGRYDEAEQHLAECQRLEGITRASALEWTLLQAQRGEVGEVERVLHEQVDRGSPEAPQILEALAQGYNDAYRLDAAMYCLDRLLEREPDNVQALLLRASLSGTAGDTAAAEQDYRRAIEAQPDHVEARMHYGDLLLGRKQAAEAVVQYEYARQRRGGDRPAIRLGLARCRLQLGDFNEARRLLDQLLARNPRDEDALVERGKLALEGESPAAAESWLRQALAEYPFDSQAHYLLARALREQDKVEEAHQHEAARQGIESDLKALEAAFKRVIRAPHDPEPRLQAGLICFRNGQGREGERWLVSALQEAPEHGPTRAALADYYERIGRQDLAAPYRPSARQGGAPKLPLPSPRAAESDATRTRAGP